VSIFYFSTSNSEILYYSSVNSDTGSLVISLSKS